MSDTIVNYKELNEALLNEQIDKATQLLERDSLDFEIEEIEKGTDTPLHHAVRLEDQMIFVKLLSCYHFVETQNSLGDTPLHVAFKSKNNRFTDLILSQIKSRKRYIVNYKNNTGLSVMHIACARNKTEIVKMILLKKENVNINDAVNEDAPMWPGFTALHFAVEFQCLDIIKLLLQKHANKNVKYVAYAMPDDIANKNFGIFNYLDYLLLDEEKSTDSAHFYIACLVSNKDIVEKFLKHTENINKPIVTKNMYLGDTPLHCAARSGALDNVRVLIDSGVSIQCKNEFQMTPLHSAFYYECKLGKPTEVVDYLLNVYNLNLSKNRTDQFGLSYLHIACSRNYVQAVKHFIQSGEDLNQQVIRNNNMESSGFTPIHYAIQFNHLDTIKLLIKHGADLSFSDGNKHGTPFEFALESLSTFEAAKTILLEIPNVNTLIGKDGNNSYSMIVTNFHEGFKDSEENRDYLNELLDILNQKKCDVNQKNNHGDTPLHHACFHRPHHYKLIEKLLENGADIDIENKKDLIAFVNESEDFSRDAKFYMIFIRHIEKLHIIGHYISEKCNKLHDKVLHERKIIDPDEECITFENLEDLRQKYSHELDRMKEIVINKYSTLYSILNVSANEMIEYTKNKKLLRIIKLEESKKQYVSYGYLLKLQMEKGKNRKALIKPSMNISRLITKKDLSPNCYDKITNYLSNVELENLMKLKDLNPKESEKNSEKKTKSKRQRVK